MNNPMGMNKWREKSNWQTKTTTNQQQIDSATRREAVKSNGTRDKVTARQRTRTQRESIDYNENKRIAASGLVKTICDS